RVDGGREDVVWGRGLERQEPEPTEASEELLPFFLRLRVLLPDARLQFPRPLPESPEGVLGPPELLLVLQAILLEELVLRLDSLRLPRMGGSLVLRTRELRVAHASHLGRFLLLFLLFLFLLFLFSSFLRL